MLIGERAPAHVGPEVKKAEEERERAEQIPGEDRQRSRAEELGRLLHQIERRPFPLALFHSGTISSQTVPSWTELGRRISPRPRRSKNHQARQILSVAKIARPTWRKRERPRAWTRTPAARQLAERTRSSCSETHSRQKKRRHSGQRAAASRSGWRTQRWARETFILRYPASPATA